ncbi:MAG: NDP-sugar synthase [Candidatus Coatesbacteria bacterium]|nr:NDP-sugar synthase [Candidatus Coatesbacteria bacterium]
MKAMLFCAGIGSRLSPITDDIPKPMVEFMGKPLIDYTLSLVKDWGVREIAVNLHHHPESLERHLIEDWSNTFKVRFSRERVLLGTGGGLKEVEKYLNDGSFLTANGDFLLDPLLDISKILEMHSNNAAGATLLLIKDDSGRHTPIQTDTEGRLSYLGELLGEYEANAPRYSFCGLLILEPVIFDYLPKGRPYSVIAACIEMLKQGHLVQGYMLDGYWQELGETESYLKAHFDLLNRQSPYRSIVEDEGRFSFIQAENDLRHPCCVGANIHSGAVIRPPVALGLSCSIRDGGVVGPFTVIGEKAEVGGGAELSRTVLWGGVSVPRGIRLDGEIAYR